MHAAFLAAAAAAAATNSGSTISLVQSSEAGDRWATQPPLHWQSPSPPSPSAAATIAVHAKARRQEVLGFGAAMTDTSAYNAMVWMDSNTQKDFFEALWGKSGLGLTIGRVTLNSADYSYESFNYDDHRYVPKPARPPSLV